MHMSEENPGHYPGYVYELDEAADWLEKSVWRVRPKNIVIGSVGDSVEWRAERTGVTVQKVSVMAAYRCTVQAQSAARVVSFSPFQVMHRPEDGDLVLGAKVLAMAVTRPEWKLYRDQVIMDEGW